MTEKTARQIENMKNDYNIGVEVEMNNITRQKAAKVAAGFFGTGRFENTAWRNNYMTWSAWDAQGREWKFSRDISIHGPDDEKCECISPLLQYEDIPLLQELLRQLRHAGAVSNPSVGAGIHIHISRKEGFSVREVKNIVNIMAAHETQIGRAIRIDARRTGQYCRTVNPKFLDLMHRRNPKTMADLQDCWYEGNGADYERTRHYNESRYTMTNLHSLFTGKGIEFRQFQFSNPYTDKDGKHKRGGIHGGAIKTYIQLCLAICELAHQIRYASPKPQQRQNEKFALRCWLVRLGFIGDEFKTAREILLRNMEGNAAFRYAC